ncbi:MAG: protein-methionine-sulfoxide reductase catalytic subunit MsrP, partial [Pseudomonadota bacterium]|nr:protein-methionine-sulfoxide reductase catalytic subunit MsrP [Pseudomonadota bacterium]
MLIRTRRSWELPESAATPENVWMNRRAWLKGAGFAGLGLATSGLVPTAAMAAIGGYPYPRNEAYQLDRALTDEDMATTYTNFYEFGSSKNIWKKTRKMVTDPWAVTIDGMVEAEVTMDAEQLVSAMGGFEERLYRHRCVEAWAMAVPWSGVPLANILKVAKPLSGAKYVRFETFMDPAVAPGQKQAWYPWPYVEGLTIEEVQNELSFLATGIYGKPLPNQNGAPIRLVTPWKYGFKGIKSIRRITFTDQRPVSFWEELAGNEYGFWANVNP